MTTKKTSKQLLDEAVAATRADVPDERTVREATDRVWQRISNEAVAGHVEAASDGPLRGCEDVQRLIPAFVAGALPQARALLVKDHTQACVPCRRALMKARGAQPTTSVGSMRMARSSLGRWTRLAAAAAAVIAVLLVGTTVIGPALIERSLVADVGTLDGALYLIGDEGSQALATGDQVRARQHVRTAKGSGAMVRLADGSLIEMDERSEVSLRARLRGTAIQLHRGNIIVHAAEQGSGRLFVDSGECRVAVRGTIFAVTRGAKGSRVSVVEGEVEVRQPGRTDILQAGGQVSSGARLAAVPVEEEISWSRNGAEYVALLRELGALRRELEDAVSPAARRSSTRLLELAPSDTVVYVAIPNLAEGLGQARTILAERVAASEVLSLWWQEHLAETGLEGELDDALDRIERLGNVIDDEVVVTLGASVVDGDSGPVILAALEDPAEMLALLAEEVERLNEQAGETVLQLVEDPSQAVDGGEQLLLWVTGDLLIGASSIGDLVEMAAIVADPAANPWLDTELFALLSNAYANGVEWLGAVDAGSVIAHAASIEPDSNNEQVLEEAGILDLSIVMAERYRDGDRQRFAAAATFDGPRRGLAAWLAEPGPIGSLEFISADASFASGAVFLDAEDMAQDLLAMASAGGADVLAHLEEVRQETGIDLLEDLAAPLGGELALALDGPVLPTPSWRLVVEVYDEARLQHTLEQALAEIDQTLTEEGEPGIALEESSLSGRTMYSLVRGNGSAYAHYVFADGYLVAAPRPALLDQALQCRSSGFNLAASPDFRQLLPEDGHAYFSAVVYQNVGPLLGSLADVVAGAQLDGEQMVLFDELGQDEGPGLICAYGEIDRITVNCTSLLSGVGVAQLMAVQNLFGAISNSGSAAAVSSGG